MSKFNTSTFIVDMIKEAIREYSSDSELEDEYIYAIASINRSLLLYREAQKNKLLSKLLYTAICMPLELSNSIPCDCVDENLGCTVLKSCFKVPKPLKSYFKEFLFVTTLDGGTEFIQQEPREAKFNKGKRTNANAPYWTIYNQYLYLINYPLNALPVLLIELIPEDLEELDQINMCDDDSSSDDCAKIEEGSFIDAHLLPSLIQLTLKTLGLTKQMPLDQSNNANGTPDNLSY